MKKKILLAVLVVVSVVGLASCKKKPVEPPVLHGIVDVEIVKGSKFDALEGVTAVDEVDGDLTASIVVTGEVDTSKDGINTLTYKVENKAGKKAEKTRKVTVYTPNAAPKIPGVENQVLAVGEAFVITISFIQGIIPTILPSTGVLKA